MRENKWDRTPFSNRNRHSLYKQHCIDIGCIYVCPSFRSTSMGPGGSKELILVKLYVSNVDIMVSERKPPLLLGPRFLSPSSYLNTCMSLFGMWSSVHLISIVHLILSQMYIFQLWFE